MKLLILISSISLGFSQINIALVEAFYEKYVDDFGRVRYNQITVNDKKSLKTIMSQIQKFNPAVAPKIYKTRNDKLATWINIYNILVINEVVESYPLRSIQEIPNVWKKKHDLGKLKISLDEIEHEKLTKAFNEPRIHFALICAAYSCPKLQRFCYKGDKLEEQFQLITKEFFENRLNFYIDKETKEMYVSRLFEWYVHDFAFRPRDKNITDFLPSDKIVLKYIADNASQDVLKYITENRKSIKVKYMVWHWKLNESFN